MRIHVFRTSLVNCTLGIANYNVSNTNGYEHLCDAETSSASTIYDDLCIFRSTLSEFKSVEYGCDGNDSCSMLVIVKYRYFETLAKCPFDLKTLWSLNVF